MHRNSYMTHNTKEVLKYIYIYIYICICIYKTTIRKNNTINLILTLNCYASSHKNRGQEQLGFGDT